MQLLITSVDALWDEKLGDFFPGILDAMQTFKKVKKGNEVVIVSIHRKRLHILKGTKLTPFHIPPGYRKLRRNAKLVDLVVSDVGGDYSKVFILAAKDDDFFMASNAKIVFFRALYASSNNPEDRLFSKDYGIPFNTTEQLSDFISSYVFIENPWFFQLDVDEDTKIYSLINANTMGGYRDTRMIIAEKMGAYLKAGIDTNKDAFGTYLIMAVNKIFREERNIDYFGYYPSSSVEPNAELEHLKRRLKTTFSNQRLDENILVRTEEVTQRKKKSKGRRIAEGCDTELTTILINDKFEGKLEGTTVCIIDDFTTYGTSCETVRHLLRHAGVAKVIFITLGKFGRAYNSYEYKLSGNPYTKISIKRKEDAKPLDGKFNESSKIELIESLKGIL